VHNTPKWKFRAHFLKWKFGKKRVYATGRFVFYACATLKGYGSVLTVHPTEKMFDVGR
jgi:hypothetical protein